MATNIVALFDTRDHAQTAVTRLIDAGLDRSKISVVESHDGKKIETTSVDSDGNLAAEGASAGISSGALVGGAIGLLAGIGLGAVPFLGFLVAGPLAGLLTGAAAGAATGGILGGLVGLGIPEDEAHVYAEGVRRGGTLVAAEVEDADADRLRRLLSDAGAIDIDERGASYRSQGFTGYDANAPHGTGAYADNDPTIRR